MTNTTKNESPIIQQRQIVRIDGRKTTAFVVDFSRVSANELHRSSKPN